MRLLVPVRGFGQVYIRGASWPDRGFQPLELELRWSSASKASATLARSPLPRFRSAIPSSLPNWYFWRLENMQQELADWSGPRCRAGSSFGLPYFPSLTLRLGQSRFEVALRSRRRGCFRVCPRPRLNEAASVRKARRLGLECGVGRAVSWSARCDPLDPAGVLCCRDGQQRKPPNRVTLASLFLVGRPCFGCLRLLRQVGCGANLMIPTCLSC